ncbi:hypothetical protein FKW77_009722 [Venturia effusa]|uniref:Uncharacterized protein n=1 Tax=Venturia effusa TaxID=50376 RepID=A0A517LEP4_9PEZI|nr:hypothetical protein FKW77_009722 [Venturia effusa]
MAPLSNIHGVPVLMARATNVTSATFGNWRAEQNPEVFVVESWGEGFMFGALLIMSCITISNMRRGVLLHKLILLELLLAMTHGTFCFFSFDGYGYYLSSTAALLYLSYFTHNVVAWMKIKPFFSGPQASFRPCICQWVKRIYIGTLALTFPVLAFEIYNNFRFFNNQSELYKDARPYEPLMRDPWWIFSCGVLLHVTRKAFSLKIFTLVRKSPRFGILLVAIFLAISFTIIDILSSVIKGLSTTDGINPYWKLALVFKCLTDNIMLDDFKSVLQRLGAVKLDGTTAMQSNSLNMTPNEKAALADDEDELTLHHHRLHIENLDSDDSHRWMAHRREERVSLSGRILDDGEALDSHGRSRRKQSIASSTVGKIGVRLPHLPTFHFLQSRAERDAKRNMQKNSRFGGSESGSPTRKKFGSVSEDTGMGAEEEEELPPWERLDFITALTDPDVEAQAGPRKKKRG